MNGSLVFWCVLGVATLGLALALTFYFSGDSRLRRRRRKSHSKIISKARKPIVRFSVRPPKEK